MKVALTRWQQVVLQAAREGRLVRKDGLSGTEYRILSQTTSGWRVAPPSAVFALEGFRLIEEAGTDGITTRYRTVGSTR